MKKVSLLITDLDNTLWDWFGIWHSSFSAMVDELAMVTRIDREILLNEIKVVHQKHHTSEYSFVLQEMPCLRNHIGRDVKAIKDFPTVVEAARVARDSAMHLYPSVADSLRVIKARGTRIVAFTESQTFYTTQRLRKLGLDGVIDVLYSTPDQVGLSPEELENVRKYDPGHYDLKHTEVRPLPPKLLKPSPEILQEILQEEAHVPDEAIYVGDSLMKDMLMAKKARVTAVHAEYGTSHNDPRYDLLKRVTHWTSEDVAREQKVKKEHVNPDVVLKEEFGELLGHFRFESGPPNSFADYKDEIEIWKETVATQRHFNELQLQLRSILVTLLTAVVGAAGYAMTQKSSIEILGAKFTLGFIVAIAGLFALVALQFYERGYHQLLLGAVSNGVKIEKRLKRRYPGITLGHEISDHSHKKWLFIEFGSIGRLRVFYGMCYAVIVGLILVTWFSKPANDSSIEKPTASELAMGTYYANRHRIGVEQVCNMALEHFRSESAKIATEKQVAVFDIDETALSTWPILAQGKFEWNKDVFEKFVKDASAEPIVPALLLYQEIRKAGVPVVFLSSRREDLRKPTEENLRNAGFRDFENLILKPDTDKRSTKQYKQETRDELEETRTIIINVGDQASDLTLPPRKSDFLIPNPFYTSS